MSKKGGGGGQSAAQTVTQTTDPPAYLAPYLTQAAGAAQGIYNKGAPSLYPGQTYTPINAIQKQGLDQTLAYGNSGQSQYATDALNALQSSANSQPGQGNPYLDQLLNTYGQKANQMVAGNFNSAGRYGSGSHAAAAGTAITNATLPILSQQYNTDMANKLSSAALLPNLSSQADQQQLTKAQAVGSVGDAYQAQDDSALNEAMTRYQYEHGGGENAALDNYLRQLGLSTGGMNLSSGSTTSTGQTQKTSGVGSTIGSLTSGLGAIGGLGKGLGGFLGGGSALAGAMGGSAGWLGTLASVAGIFSDERLKENIEHVGVENGHNVYEFEYLNGSGKRYRGVMAQEVLEKNPSAIMMDKSGYMAVDYSKIGVRFREVEGVKPLFRAAAPVAGVVAGAVGCDQSRGV